MNEIMKGKIEKKVKKEGIEWKYFFLSLFNAREMRSEEMRLIDHTRV